jgi:hypothetical protein
MDRNLVPIRLGRAPPQRARIGRAGDPVNMFRRARICRANLSVFKNKDFAAPVNGVISKAAKPDCEGDQIAQRHEPQMPPKGAVMDHANTYVDGYSSA